jgi:DnaK suppressor protein
VCAIATVEARTEHADRNHALATREGQMSQITAPPAHRQPSRDAHEMLTRRYDETYETWFREDAVVHAMRQTVESGPGDDADHATTRAQLDEQTALARSLRAQLDDLTVALERCESGTYGVCDRCHQDIPDERLALFPAATHCVPCKQALERR